MFMFQGLEYIHKSSVHYHGNLKSTNCVVDSRWTCKLTDFGVANIREQEQAALSTEEKQWESKIIILISCILDKEIRGFCLG